MSKLKFSPNLFLESQELNKFQDFIFDEGFIRLLLLNSQNFGVVNNTRLNGSFTNGLVEVGTTVGTIKHSNLYAIDVNGQLIYKAATDNIALTNDNQWRWLKIKYASTANEIGTVSIDASGNVTGDGSIDFTDLLRGQPNIPSRVAFSNATLNTGEYDVLEVVDSDTIILQGTFSPESSLVMKVVGSFSPTAVIPSADKDIFQYDGCTMTLVLETVSETPPTLLTDEEFVLARVKRNGATVVVQDKRLLNIYKTKADRVITGVVDTANALIGVEAIKYDQSLSTRENNLVFVAWSFRSNNWTVDTNTNKVTLNAGLGGKFKTTNDFTDGDFDGWRLYAKDGTYSIIQDSYKSGSQINLILDSLEPTKFSDTTAWLNVTPNAEEIELFFSQDVTDDDELTQKKLTYPINTVFAVVPLLCYATPTCTYGVRYRYKTLDTFGTYRAFPSDLVSGFLNESSFNDSGDQTSTSRTTYTASFTLAFITLTQAGNAYSQVISGLSTGDLGGVEYVAINTSVDPVTRMVVGTRKQHTVITNDSVIDPGDDSDFGAPYSLTADAYIDLRTDLPSNLKNGNSFILQIRGEYLLAGHVFKITQNYVNSGNVGTVIYSITANDLLQAVVDNLLFYCKYNGTNWFVHKFISSDGSSVPSSRSIGTTSPLTGGGTLAADLTLAINNAAADGATKGAAAFAAADFNSSSGVISLDYTNGQAASAGAKGYLTSTDWSTFNGKQAALGYTPLNELITTNRQTSNYQLVLGDQNKLVEMNLAGANNLTVPANATVAFPIGAQVMVSQFGAGKTTIVAAGGVTLYSDSGLLSIGAQYAAVALIKINTNEWYVFGSLQA